MVAAAIFLPQPSGQRTKLDFRGLLSCDESLFLPFIRMEKASCGDAMLMMVMHGHNCGINWHRPREHQL